MVRTCRAECTKYVHETEGFLQTKTETYDVIQSTRIENSSNDNRNGKHYKSTFSKIRDGPSIMNITHWDPN